MKKTIKTKYGKTTFYVRKGPKRATAEAIRKKTYRPKKSVLRPEIKKFAEHMEVIMRVHDEKKGDSWKQMSILELEKLLAKEWREYVVTGHEMELIDMTNFCMMIWSRKEALRKEEK